ncbi:MAG: hypothetical protein ACYDHP_10835 [Ferrimicrobium sp.]
MRCWYASVGESLGSEVLAREITLLAVVAIVEGNGAVEELHTIFDAEFTSLANAKMTSILRTL